MKKINVRVLMLFVVLLSATYFTHAQNAERKWGAGLFITLSDYNGDLGNEFWEFNNANPILGTASLSRYLNSSFDAVLRLSVLNVEAGNGSGYFDDWLHNANLNFKYKFNNGYCLNEDAFLSPYLVAGIGYTHAKAKGSYMHSDFSKKYDNMNFYYGAGLHFKVDDRWSIEVESGILYPLSDRYDGLKNKRRDTEMYHDKWLQNTVGVVYNFGKSTDSDGDGVGDNRDDCPNTPAGVAVDKHGCPLDSDGDGVADYQDECPMLAGSILLNGCPDTDGDGVPDKDDACPDVKGEVQFNGCPDTDGDGVQDSEDQCPEVKGLKALNGCPDTDGDGVTDSKDKCPNTKPGYQVDANGCALDNDKDGVVNEEDKCPDVAGPATNFGCPEVKAEVKKNLEFAAKNVQFASGKDILTAKSKKILDEVVQIMNDYPAYALRISGYTDSMGKDDMNLKLSEKRAQATKNYLSAKGISASKIDAKGYGEANPIASNDTASGRAQNRRVEFELYIK